MEHNLLAPQEVHDFHNEGVGHHLVLDPFVYLQVEYSWNLLLEVEINVSQILENRLVESRIVWVIFRFVELKNVRLDLDFNLNLFLKLLEAVLYYFVKLLHSWISIFQLFFYFIGHVIEYLLLLLFLDSWDEKAFEHVCVLGYVKQLSLSDALVEILPLKLVRLCQR